MIPASRHGSGTTIINRCGQGPADDAKTPDSVADGERLDLQADRHAVDWPVGKDQLG